MPRLDYSQISKKRIGDKSKVIKERVDKAISIQNKRQYYMLDESVGYYNSELPIRYIEKYCRLAKEGEELLKMAILELGLSARAYDHTLKVARTIADLEGKEEIQAGHISEAISYRSLDRDFWLA